MEGAAAVRQASRAAVEDIAPGELRDDLLSFVDEGSMAPGALVVRSARTVDGDVEFETVSDRAVGVQLVYEGLRLTRRLSHDPPWGADGDTPADLEVLAADILVARGAYLLAGTEASDPAVDVIRGFGRDQTLRRSAEDPAVYDRRLEADVLELAAIAGTTAAGPWPSAALRARLREFATSLEDARLPAPDALPEDLDDEPAATDAGGDDIRVRFSTDGNG